MKASRKTIVFSVLSMLALVVSAFSITAVNAQNVNSPAKPHVPAVGAPPNSVQGTWHNQDVSAVPIGRTSIKGSAPNPSKVNAHPGPYLLPGHPNLPNSLIGKNNEKYVSNDEVYPYSSIVVIMAYFASGPYYLYCTGFYVAPDVVLTTDWCLWDPTPSDLPTSITVYSDLYYDTGLAEYFALYTDTVFDLEFDTTDSWGVLYTNGTIGDNVGWLGTTSYVNAKNHDKYPGSYSIYGFPLIEADSSYSMWGMKGSINKVTGSDVTEGRLWYKTDTYQTQRGAPVYLTTKYHGVSSYWAVGINSWDTGIDPYPTYNSASRVTQTVIGWICFFDPGVCL